MYVGCFCQETLRIGVCKKLKLAVCIVVNSLQDFMDDTNIPKMQTDIGDYQAVRV